MILKFAVDSAILEILIELCKLLVSISKTLDYRNFSAIFEILRLFAPLSLKKVMIIVRKLTVALFLYMCWFPVKGIAGVT